MFGEFENVYDVLKNDDRLVAYDGTLMKNRIYELSSKLDETFLQLLLDNEVTKNMFFKNVNGIFVFDSQKFNWVIDSKEFLPDSYSEYKKDIMLVDDNNNSISKRDNVVLSFSYKDCILEMDSTEETEKRKEVFFNETLMKKEIDTLLSPKVFANAKRISKNGEETAIDIHSDNLIIKGNNLLSMYSLVPRYKGKIKCMYWDILYNREKDYVPYNDSFKHTSWLTMMKNRLDVSKTLLKKDGVIFLQCDDTEMHYLKVLCDEIYGRDNYVNTLSIKMKNLAGASGGGEDKRFKKNIEYILIYAKDYESLEPFNGVYVYTEMSELIEQYIENGVDWKYKTILYDAGEKEYIGSTVDGTGNEIKVYKRINPIYKSIKQAAKDENITEKEVYSKYGTKIFQTTNAQSSIRTRIIDYRIEQNIQEDLLSIEYIPKTGRNKGTWYEQFYKGDKCRLFAWLKDTSEEKDGILYKKEMQGTYWDFTGAMKNVNKEGQVQLANGKKPEELVGAILDCCMKSGDIVLDAYLGSGTTAAVAHKKGLTYIGLEQLDKHIELAKTRLSNVINGDKSGISSDENWNGGGSYIYCELAENSQTYIDKIYKANTIEELVDIFNFLKESEFISYRVDINKMKDDDFIQLSIDDAKKVLISIIDKNTLYINYSDMDNEDYVIDDNDKAFTKDFYEGV